MSKKDQTITPPRVLGFSHADGSNLPDPDTATSSDIQSDVH